MQEKKSINEYMENKYVNKTWEKQRKQLQNINKYFIRLGGVKFPDIIAQKNEKLTLAKF